MHHFMSTPVPGTSTKCHTLSTALSLFRLSFLSSYNFALCFPYLSSLPPLPPRWWGRTGLRPLFPFFPLSSLSPALFFLGRQTGHIPQGGPGALFWHVSALHPTLNPLFLLSSPPMHPPTSPQCAASLPLLFTSVLSGYMYHLPNPSALLTHFLIWLLTIYSIYLWLLSIYLWEKREREREDIVRERWRHWHIRQREASGGVWRLEMAVISLRFPRGPRKRRLCVLTTLRCQEFCVCVSVSVCLFCSSAHWHWCLSTNTSLHYTFRWETQAWRKKEREKE